jgi:predicted ester cyclase
MTDPLTLFRRLIDEGFTQADDAAIDEIVSPDFVEHQFVPPGAPGVKVGPAGVKAVVAALHRGAGDFRLTIDDAVVGGDTVWARLSGTGTDTGGQLGRPPTHRPFAITVIDIVRFVDDRAVEHWGVPDRFTLLQQLGLLPADLHRRTEG